MKDRHMYIHPWPSTARVKGMFNGKPIDMKADEFEAFLRQQVGPYDLDITWHDDPLTPPGPSSR